MGRRGGGRGAHPRGPADVELDFEQIAALTPDLILGTTAVPAAA